ncbi:MAG: hypothetical protein OXI50_03090 [Gammaproteobacteria bacterium]|nr:hypothetical protein [Gammaproteobacteria bacterium]
MRRRSHRRPGLPAARVYLFADEAGNFDFSRKAGASRFYILTTVAFPEGHDALATSLRRLRFELAWEGVDFRREFHATDDTVAVREREPTRAGAAPPAPQNSSSSPASKACSTSPVGSLGTK